MILQKAREEIRRIGLVTFYFFCCFWVILFLKRLMLAEYEIQFRGISYALLGALVVAKVVVVMEKVPLGRWVQRQPVIADISLRTALYSICVLIAFLLEKAFESRHEYGGFGRAVIQVFEHREIHHVWVGTICVGLSLLAYNALAIVSRYLGEGGLSRLFFSTTLAELEAKRDTPSFLQQQSHCESTATVVEKR